MVSSCLGESVPALRKKAWRLSKKLPFLVAGKDIIMSYCKQTMVLAADPKILVWGSWTCLSTLCSLHQQQKGGSTRANLLVSPNLSPCFPAKARALVLDVEDCCCFPLQCLLLPLQNGLEASKSSLGPSLTQGYCTHRQDNPLWVSLAQAWAKIKAGRETHVS